MMRGLFVVTGILGLVASTAMAAPTITITGPGGVSSYEPVPGASFQIEITIQSDFGNMSAWGMNLTRPAAYGNLASLSLGRSYSDASVYDPDEDVTTYINQQGWDVGNSVPWAAGTNPIVLGTIWDNPTQGATGGWACKVRLVAPADPMMLAGEVNAVGAYLGNMAGQAQTPTIIPLILTPEPVSALLLLAGLPMLRRRR